MQQGDKMEEFKRGRVVHCKKEPYDVYIGRPSKYGNPFKIGRDGSRAEVIQKYRIWLASRPELVEDMRKNLKGKVLGCWCKPEACHGDVILEVISDGEDGVFYESGMKRGKG